MLTICSRAGARSVQTSQEAAAVCRVPESYTLPYKHLDSNRQEFAGMLAALDEQVGRLEDGFTAKGLWDQTLTGTAPQLPCCHGTRLALIGVVRSVLSVFRRQRRAGGQPRRQALGLELRDGHAELAAEGRKRYVYGRTALFASRLTFPLLSRELLTSRQGPCTRAGCDRPRGCTARCLRIRARC